MCVSLDEPELVDSVLTFPSGYDTNKLSGAEEIAVAFTQEYSRVSYPLGNVGTLSKGSGSSKDTHTGVGRIGQRGLRLESMFRRRDHVTVILRAIGFDRHIQADSSNNTCSIQYPNVEDY